MDRITILINITPGKTITSTDQLYSIASLPSTYYNENLYSISGRFSNVSFDMYHLRPKLLVLTILTKYAQSMKDDTVVLICPTGHYNSANSSGNTIRTRKQQKLYREKLLTNPKSIWEELINDPGMYSSLSGYCRSCNNHMITE